MDPLPPAPDAVVLTPEAERDIADHVAYLDARNPYAADDFHRTLSDEFDRLATRVVDGQLVVLPNGGRCRRWLVHPMAIFYERAPGTLYVLRVYHHARRPLR
jgi:plasmid stabilization system protein ParE